MIALINEKKILEIIKEVNMLRVKYPLSVLKSGKLLNELSTDVMKTNTLSKQYLVSKFIEEVRGACYENISLDQTKKCINNGTNEQFIFSIFDASYFPKLGLDCLFYNELVVDRAIRLKYKSPVKAVNIINASDGFLARTVVALFPENHLNGEQKSDDSIFYFINKFVERFYSITRKMLLEIVADDYFSELVLASSGEIEKASAYWVWLHEYHHRQGAMPIPMYLSLKSNKPLAGLEELRVDICSMLVCLEDSDFPEENREFTFKYILAERLFRYAVEGIPNPNYDAVSSQLLFNYLIKNKGIVLSGWKVKVTNNITNILKLFLSEINSIEEGILYKNDFLVKEELLQFTNKYTNYDEENDEYEHIEYFKDVKIMMAL